MNTNIFLRFGLIIIFIMHSVTGMLDGGINDFGNNYLNEVGFAPLGLPLAWMIKLSHLAAVFSLVLNKGIKVMGAISILILVIGIIMIHGKEGWFVVGGGRNGMEFNFLLILVWLQVMFPRFELSIPLPGK